MKHLGNGEHILTHTADTSHVIPVRYIWGYMGIYGDIWVYMGIYGYLWVSMGIYGYLWVSMGIYLSIDRSIDPSIHLSIYRSIDLSIYRSIDLSIDRSICLSVYLSIYLSIYLSMRMGIRPQHSLYPLVHSHITSSQGARIMLLLWLKIPNCKCP